MKIGIIGLPQSGKKTIFRLLTETDLKNIDPEKLKAPIRGVAVIKDPRFEKIASMYSPKKKTPAKIEIVLMPKMDKEYIISGNLFKRLDDAEAICHIVRAFVDESIYHIDGSVDAVRDIDSINSELVLSDLLFVEKRLERIESESKKARGDKQADEKKLLLKFKGHLENELPLRLLELTADESRVISSYPFITIKPLLIVLNIDEEDLKKSVLPENSIQKYKSQNIYIAQISAKIEDELSRFDSKEERDTFLRELQIEEPAMDKLTRLLYEALGLISFFTAGSDEVRSWAIKKGSAAPVAAGAIHSDMEKGFIRAEVVRCADLIELGSESKVKGAGKLMIKGKDYVVSDGDILNIRFNI